MHIRFEDFGYPVDIEVAIIDNNLLTLGYHSIAEQSRYMLQCEVDASKTLVVGTAPYGGVAIWHEAKSEKNLVKWDKATIIPTQNEQREKSIYDAPPRNLFDRYMQQFTYRYLPLFEKWEDEEEVKWHKYEEDEIQPEFEYIEEALFDGTFDKLHDDSLLKYHEAGKPKKLAIKWQIDKSEYSAYFWFDNEKICSIFERFYGVHPDTKTDFIVRIDAEKKKYELSLFRQGLKEPLVIPEETYQLLVFKNKFEDYRSKNYNQERGAWVW